MKFKSPLHEKTQATPTRLWNDSPSLQELNYALDHRAVGATCSPVIVGEVLKKEMPSSCRPLLALFDGWTWLAQSKETKFERPCLLRNCYPMYHAIVHRLAILPA